MTDAEREPTVPVGSTPHDDDSLMNAIVIIEPSAEDATIPELAKVDIRDVNHPGLRASWEYRITDMHGGLRPIGFSVTQWVTGGPQEAEVRLGPGMIKDLPLARWDRLAQAAIGTTLMHRSLMAASRPLGHDLEEDYDTDDADSDVIATPLHVPRDRRQRAIEMVRRVKPDLDPEESRGAARSWNGLVRLAEATDEYMELLAKGIPDVVGEMAKLHGVAPATVRTWIFRARQAGLAATGSGNQTSRPVESNPEGSAPGVGRSLTPEEAGSPGPEPAEPDVPEPNKIGKTLSDARRLTGALEELRGKLTTTLAALETAPPGTPNIDIEIQSVKTALAELGATDQLSASQRKGEFMSTSRAERKLSDENARRLGNRVLKGNEAAHRAAVERARRDGHSD